MPLDPRLAQVLMGGGTSLPSAGEAFNGVVDPQLQGRVPALQDSLPDEAYANKYPNLPASANIEDRRGEAGLHALLQSWTGLTSDQWATALQHPMTPFWQLFPPDPTGANPNSPLAREAGINSIAAPPMLTHNGMLPHLDPDKR